MMGKPVLASAASAQKKTAPVRGPFGLVAVNVGDQALSGLGAGGVFGFTGVASLAKDVDRTR